MTFYCLRVSPCFIPKTRFLVSRNRHYRAPVLRAVGQIVKGHDPPKSTTVNPYSHPRCMRSCPPGPSMFVFCTGRIPRSRLSDYLLRASSSVGSHGYPKSRLDGHQMLVCPCPFVQKWHVVHLTIFEIRITSTAGGLGIGLPFTYVQYARRNLRWTFPFQGVCSFRAVGQIRHRWIDFEDKYCL